MTVRRVSPRTWLTFSAGILCSIVATVLYFDVPHRLFPDSLSITVTSSGAPTRYHLGCNPTAGDLPDATAACHAMRYLFANHSVAYYEGVMDRRCGPGPMIRVQGSYDYKSVEGTVDLSCPMATKQRAFWARVGGFRTHAQLGPFPEKPATFTVTKFFYLVAAGCVAMAIWFAFSDRAVLDAA